MRYIFLVFFFCSFNFFAKGQSYNYVKGTLDITLDIFNPCGSPAPNNGHIEFTINAADGGSATLIFLDGPGGNDIISPVVINVGSTFSFNASNTLPDGSYNFIIRDQLGNETINTFAEPVPYPALTLIDIGPVSLSQDILVDNTVCTNPTNGQLQSSISGGSMVLAGGGSFNYEWSSTNGLAGLPLTGTSDGTAPLNLATLLGVPGIPGGTYTLKVVDNFSACGEISRSFTLTDPSPAVQTVTTPSPLDICTGDAITITMNNSESGVTYTILRNGVATSNTFLGTGTGPFIMTFPSTGFVDNDVIQVRATNGFCTPVTMSNTVLLNINPLPTIVGVVVGSVCSGSTSTNLNYTSTTGSPNQYSIDFDATAEAQGFIDVVNAALPASPVSIVVPPAAAPGNYNAVITVRNSATTCSSTSTPITITIIANPTITLGANPSVCSGTLTANLPYTATTGSPNRYSINFNPAAEAQGFVDVVNAVLPASPIVITVPGAAIANTYNATLTVTNTGSTCTSSSQPITVTINPNPTITLGANPSVCSGTTTTNLTYSATTGSPNQYSIDFNAAAQTQGFVDVVNAALPASPIVIAVPGAAAAGTYNATLSVRNSATGCLSGTQPITVTVIASPTITLGANPAVCLGSTTANLPYTGTSGSPNQYSINFNAAAEAQGFVDVVNVVLPASPIMITIPGAAVAGTYNATLSVLNTVTGCSSPGQPITVTINPNPTITLGPNPSVCSGTTTASLTYSATTGSPNQYSINFNGAAEAQGFADVTNVALPASPISIVVPGAAAAGTYNATLTIRNTTTGCVSSSSPISVTIIANPTITLGANPSVCVGATSANLPYTATTGTPDQYSINFNATAEAQGFVDVVNAALPATPIVITVPGAAVAGVYSATLSIRNSTTGCVSGTQPITVTLIANPTITLGPNPSVCIGSTSANLTYTGTTGSPNQYSIDFNAAAEGQGFVDVVNAALPASPIAITIPGAAIAGAYNATLTVRNTVTGCVGTAVPITITINPTPTITLGANPSVCSGATAAPLTYSATTGTPNQYSINFNAAAEAQGFADVTNVALPASPISVVVPGAAAAGTYNATLTVRNSATGCVSSSAPISVTIIANPTITLGANPSVCVGSTSANLLYTATTGTPDQYSINFNAAAEAQGFVDVVNAALPATPIAITVPGAAVAGVYSATLSIRNSTTGCVSSTQPITVTLVANPTITLGPNPAVCIGSTSANLTYTGTTGSPNQYSIDFNAGAEGQGFVDIVNAALPASPIAITVPGAAVAGTYSATLTVRNTVTGCAGAAMPITVTISPTPTITLGANPSVCSGTTSAPLTYSATTGSPNQYSINFNAAAEAQGFADVTNIALPVSSISIVVPGAAAAGTYNATITVRNSTTGCVSAATPISVTIQPSPTITLGANPSVCLGASTANLTYSATTGTPNQYSINFNAAAEAQGFVDVVNIALPASPIVINIPAAAVAGTYNATLTVLNTTTTCTSAAQPITVTINPVPGITLGPNPSVCIGAATAALTYSAITGTPNQYSLDFDAAAQAQGFTDIVNAVLPASPISIAIPGAAIAGTYNATLTVQNTTTGCGSTSQPVTVTIQTTPTITLGANPSVCIGATTAALPYSATTGAPDQYSIDFNAAAEAQGFVDVANTTLPATPISIVIPATAVDGIYNATITVTNSIAGCSSSSQPITVTISPVASITGVVVGSVCEGSTTTNLNYTGTTGAPDQYSIDYDAAAEAQGFTDVVSSAFTASPVALAIPATAIAGNYNAILTVTNSTASCPSAGVPITITILPSPSITLGANPSICIGSPTASLTYTATTGTPNQYSIDFNAAAEAQGFVDIANAALPASPITIAIPGAAVVGTYNAAITVRNTSSTCASSSQPITITINDNPTITLGPSPSVCAGIGSVNLPYTGTTGTPDRYSIDYNAAAEVQGFVDVASTSLPVSPISLVVPLTASSGIYNGVLTVINTTTGCVSSATPFSITITPSPTATISGTAAICNGSQTPITINFTGTAPWSFQYSDGTTTIPAVSPVNSITFNVQPTANTTYTLLSVSDAGVPMCPGIVNGSAVITVNQNPLTNLAVGATPNPLCSGGIADVTVSNSELGVSYQLRNSAGNVAVGPPVVGTGATINLPTGVLLATQTFNVLATATGCTPVQLTNTVTVNVSGAVDPSLAVTAVDPTICEGTGTNIQVINSENGVLYQLRNDATNAPVGVSVPGTGGTIDLATGNLTATTSFNVLATNGSCSIELTDIETVTVNVNPNPGIPVNVIFDPVCIGGSSVIVVSLTEPGVSYQLRTEPGNVDVGVPVNGNNGNIDLPTGPLTTTSSFNVLATSGVCTPVELTTTVTVNVSGNIDASLSVTAVAPTICSGTGTDIEVANSEMGVSYQLRDDANNSNVGSPVAGTGGTIILPTGNLPLTTTFYVLADNGTCSIELTDQATVTVDPAPDASLLVSPTLNPVCVGGSTAITVMASQLGVTYQLRNDADDSDVGPAVTGTGSDINLPTGPLSASTIFYVLASSGVCTPIELTMKASVTVTGTLNAGLTVNSSSSSICSGTSTFVQVLLSENGVTYQLQIDATSANVGTAVAGNGGTLSFPTGNLSATTTFKVLANNGTCSMELTDKETITVNPAPDVTLAVAPASGLICSGTSTSIIVTNSESGVTYQLRTGTTNVGSALVSTGGDLSLPTGNLTTNTTFNVLATIGSCSAQLTATASVAIRPIGDPACGPGGSDCANFSAITPTITVQPSCNDRDAGIVTFTIARADATATTFRVIWSYNGTDQTKFTSGTVAFNDLNSGLYKYTIIDEGNGKTCGPVDFFLDLKTQVEIQDKEVLSTVSCFGGSDGNVKLTVDGTTTGEYWYKYVLDGQESVAQTFTPGAPLPGGLPADDDDFIIIKVDESAAFSCPDTVMVRIKHAFPKIDFTVASTMVTTCNGTDGAIQVSGITGGNTTSGSLQIRLKKEVPLSTDPSGFITVVDFQDVNTSFEYTALSQGNYVVDIKDQGDCIQSKPIAIQAPGQVPLSVIDIVATDASCSNEGASGNIQVTINEPGIYEVAVSQDQVNVPPDEDFVDYNSPSLPSITFSNLTRGRYFLYIKSSTTQCPTRTDVIEIGGVYAVSDFDVISNCENVNITINNITGQQDAPFVIRVFSNDDKFFKIDSVAASSIPLSNSISFNYTAPLGHAFLTEPGTYRFVMVQSQTTGSGTCVLVSDTVVYDIRQQIGIVLGQIKPSFPDPKRTGGFEVDNIVGGTRFISGANELYYEVSVTTAGDDITVFDWTQVKLNPQNKFFASFDYLPPGVYRVKVRDAAGCIKVQDVEITLDPSVYVPNIFTPNDDAVNDEFEVLNLPLGGKHKLIISNRWGNQVFSSDDYREGNFWNAEGASDGIYFYRLKVEGGETFSGWVEVLRGNKP